MKENQARQGDGEGCQAQRSRDPLEEGHPLEQGPEGSEAVSHGTPWKGVRCIRCTNEETKAQRNYVMCLCSHSTE